MKHLVLENITIYRNRNSQDSILKDINLNMESGQILGILGPNGCGKTSLIRALAGFIPLIRDNGSKFESIFGQPSWGAESRQMSGNIYLDGENITLMSPKNRNFALVPQNLALYPNMTVLENISFPLVARKTSGNEARNRAGEMAAWLELDKILNCYPSEISGGQQQRVAIGRALIGEPRLILLDEPLASLDIFIKNEILNLISQVLKEKKSSAIYVTHDPYEASTICDHVAFIDHGYVNQVATPERAYHFPETLFVARMFGGFSNIIPGQLIQSGSFVVSENSGNWDLSSFLKKDCRFADQSILLGGRPSAFQINGFDGIGLSGKISSLFNLREETFARVELSTGLMVVCSAKDGLNIGTQVKVGLSSSTITDIRLFDREGKLFDFNVTAHISC